MSCSVQLGAYMEGYEQGQADMLAHYSRALDEVFVLRRALAVEARVTAAHLLLKTFPASRRFLAEQQVERMRESARGNASAAYYHMAGVALQNCLREAGADEGLTRAQWENTSARTGTNVGEA
jgi:hypothetical protein